MFISVVSENWTDALLQEISIIYKDKQEGQIVVINCFATDSRKDFFF